MRFIRRIFQTAILLCVLYLALGYGQRSFENYCPFGGIESLYSLLKQGTTSCAVSPWNFGVLFAALGLTLAARKSFCGWICPIGFIYELLGKIQHWLFKGQELIPPSVSNWLRHLRYLVLGVVVYFSWTMGELVFRGYDPYYLFFTGGLGHGTITMTSLIILIILVAAGVLVKMAWCRYLCPMSAIMDPLTVPSPLTVKRNLQTCVNCGKCDAACDHDLQPSQSEHVRHRDCTLCLRCVDACPVTDAISLSASSPFKRG